MNKANVNKVNDKKNKYYVYFLLFVLFSLFLFMFLFHSTKNILSLRKKIGGTGTKQLNVFGKPLQSCCTHPMTGYRRNGFCETIDTDHGTHTVCALITNIFLQQQQKLGNDLITPNKMNNFPGLKEGDKWCVCALRWKQAKNAGIAPKLFLHSTNKKSLSILNMKLEDLLPYSI